MKKIILALIVLAVGVLAGCGSQGTTLKNDDAEAVLAYSEAKTDNLLAGMNASDYAAFSQDFDQDMLNGITEAEFAKLKADRDAKLGLYISREVVSVVQTGDFYAVNYKAKFEKDDAVNVRVVFRATEPHEVSGLWFSK
jgi:outer membrane murein-binding lipoprotein Lpp